MELIGSLGVAILLAAFFANLTGRLESTSRVYQSMNALGAAIAAYASWGIGFMPLRGPGSDMVRSGLYFSGPPTGHTACTGVQPCRLNSFANSMRAPERQQERAQCRPDVIRTRDSSSWSSNTSCGLVGTLWPAGMSCRNPATTGRSISLVNAFSWFADEMAS